MAVRQIRANYRSVTGLVAADQTARSTAYESTLERDFIKHLLFNKNVLEHEEQPLTLDFTDTGKKRRYTPDLLIYYRKDAVTTKDWLPLLAEVKYRSDLFQHWAELSPKFRAARAYARERTWDFAVVTERELRTPYLTNIGSSADRSIAGSNGPHEPGHSRKSTYLSIQRRYAESNLAPNTLATDSERVHRNRSGATINDEQSDLVESIQRKAGVL
jgi:hypothetical protein